MAWRQLWRKRTALVGIGIIVVLVLTALLADVLAPYEPTATGSGEPMLLPNWQHPLGTDMLGRDMLSRVIHGSRVAIYVGVLSLALPICVGIPLGVISGFYGGIIDNVIMRLMDIMLAIPGLLLAIGIVAMLGPGLTQIMVAIGVTQVPVFARLLRGSVLAQRENDFVLAARSVGVPRRSILAAHILPNAISPVIVQGTLAMATAIIDVAGLGFLGLGPQDPSTPEWGTMLTGTVRYLQTAPHLAIIPGVAIVISVLGFNLIGDGLREALDPKLRGRGRA
jgi:peptide/nickel transport system permease protein